MLKLVTNTSTVMRGADSIKSYDITLHILKLLVLEYLNYGFVGKEWLEVLKRRGLEGSW